MKILKFDHNTAQDIVKGRVVSTWRLFDDKDLSINDEVAVIDKVDLEDPSTWNIVGKITINKIDERRLGDITEREMLAYGESVSQDDAFDKYQHYYSSQVTPQTPVKILFFTFSSVDTPSTVSSRPHHKVIVNADGASRGNPGPSASGYAIYDTNKVLLASEGSYIGVTTNNQAEYTALKLALEKARSLGAIQVDVFMDSLLVVNQMKGIFKVKNRDLWPVHNALKEFCKQFCKISFTQIPRESNKIADAAANKALDQYQARNQDR